MIAMQYSFALPLDYDMTVIDRRIRDKGPMLDGFPHLRFKAYLSARKQDDGFVSADNLYAPFYLWNEAEGIGNFLSSPGFAGLTRDYGWPTVRTWVVWHASLPEHVSGTLSEARFASRDIAPIEPHADLAALRAEAVERVHGDIRDGAMALVVGFDPAGWTTVHFRLWRTMPPDAAHVRQLYRVGHVSEGIGEGSLHRL